MYTRLSLVCLWTLAVSCGIALVASPAAAKYEFKNVMVTMAPDDDVVVDLSDDPLDSHETGVRVKNLSDQSGWVRVRWLVGPAAEPGDTVEGEYRLLDLTLEVTTDLPLEDTIQIRRRMAYDDGIEPVPSGMDVATPKLMDLRERSLRILRRQSGPGPFSFSWGAHKPGVRRVYGPADFVLGHYGVDVDNSYVWAVVDVPGRFAVGGVPEPAVAALLLSGAIPLVLMLRRTRKR